ncbi:hypothetical protein KGQ34_00615 [Patescibacteria group bacterium]|nr:hypothetical protein [Patescibacteria group bacterium]
MKTEVAAEKAKASRKTFYPLRDDSGVIGGISVNAFLEFWGANAVKANEHRLADEFHFEPEASIRSSAGGKKLGAVYRAYLSLEKDTSGLFFAKHGFFPKMSDLQIVPACMKIQLMRWDGFRAVCARKSEIGKLLAEGKSPLWGFGRPHPFLPEFPIHQQFAGPITVPPPLAIEIENFEQIFLKVYQNRSGEERIYVLDVYWVCYMEDFNVVRFGVRRAEKDAPLELVSYEFSKRGNSIAVDPEQGKKNAEALEELFSRTRRPVNDGRPGSNKMDKTHR